jgi:ABC-2 type transport system ATP-binding protein
LNTADETQQAFALLQRVQEQGIDWITRVHIELNKQSLPVIRVNAPRTRSAEINALLARNNLFAAELRPQEGSLEEVFLELTTPTPPIGGARPGMAALARGSNEPKFDL